MAQRTKMRGEILYGVDIIDEGDEVVLHHNNGANEMNIDMEGVL